MHSEDGHRPREDGGRCRGGTAGRGRRGNVVREDRHETAGVEGKDGGGRDGREGRSEVLLRGSECRRRRETR